MKSKSPSTPKQSYWYLKGSAGTARSGQWILTPEDEAWHDSVRRKLRRNSLPSSRSWPRPAPLFTWKRLECTPDTACDSLLPPQVVSERFRLLIEQEGDDLASFLPVRLRGPNEHLLARPYWFVVWKRAWECQPDAEHAAIDPVRIPAEQRIALVAGTGWWSGGKVIVRDDLKATWSSLKLCGVRFERVPLIEPPDTLVRVKYVGATKSVLVERRLLPWDPMFDVKAFLSAGGDPNGSTNIPGSTAFHSYVVMHSAMGTLKVPDVRAFLKAGADVNVGTDPNVSALLTVIHPKTPELIRLLASHGANFNVGNSINGQTPLMSAIASSDCKTIAAILKAGADPNLADHGGWTPLDHALEEIESGDDSPRFYRELKALLLKAGAEPGSRPSSVRSAKRSK